MFQRAITIEQYAELYPALTVYGRVEAGMLMTTTATQPWIGSLVVLQDIATDLLILSECPVSDADLLPREAR